MYHAFVSGVNVDTCKQNKCDAHCSECYWPYVAAGHRNMSIGWTYASVANWRSEKAYCTNTGSSDHLPGLAIWPDKKSPIRTQFAKPNRHNWIIVHIHIKKMRNWLPLSGLTKKRHNYPGFGVFLYNYNESLPKIWNAYKLHMARMSFYWRVSSA